MYKGVINFTRRDCDLDRTPEYWQGESYSERIKTIQAVVQEKTTYLPTKKLQSVREGVFKVPSTITVEQLVDLSKALRRWYKIDQRKHHPDSVRAAVPQSPQAGEYANLVPLRLVVGVLRRPEDLRPFSGLPKA